jgi:cutinase
VGCDERLWPRRKLGAVVALLSGLGVASAAVAGPAAAAAERQPIEGLWFAEKGPAVYRVDRYPLGGFLGSVVTAVDGERCPLSREAGQPWSFKGSGRRYSGSVFWLNDFGCEGLWGPGKWTVSPNGRRMVMCAIAPAGGRAPGFEDKRPPPGALQCLGFVRLGLGGGLGARRTCLRYQVIGVRGSGEALSGPYEMGQTVGQAAGAIRDDLSRGPVGMFSLPYPAAPVSDLLHDLGRPFFASITEGVNLLVSYMTELRSRCPKTKVALVGYSQGAAVAGQAARAMPARLRERVRAVLLFADPYSVGRSSYAFTPALFPGGQPRRNGSGGLGPRPAALPGRTRDVCFANDVVCDAPRGLTLAILYEGLSSKVHTRYKSCCRFGRFDASLTRSFGAEAARRLQR